VLARSSLRSLRSDLKLEKHQMRGDLHVTLGVEVGNLEQNRGQIEDKNQRKSVEMMIQQKRCSYSASVGQ
jgi:hypothetical protein